MMIDRNDLVKFSREIAVLSHLTPNIRTYMIDQDCQTFTVTDGKGRELFSGRSGRAWQWLKKEMEAVKLECV